MAANGQGQTAVAPAFSAIPAAGTTLAACLPLAAICTCFSKEIMPPAGCDRHRKPPILLSECMKGNVVLFLRQAAESSLRRPTRKGGAAVRAFPDRCGIRKSEVASENRTKKAHTVCTVWARILAGHDARIRESRRIQKAHTACAVRANYLGWSGLPIGAYLL